MMADYKVAQQVRARDNAYTRDSNESGSRGYNQQFTEGQQLSLGGKKVQVLKLEGWDGSTHLVAQVQEQGKEPKRVKCQDLREMCWGRPQWSPSRAMNIDMGDFVFVSRTGEDFRRAGIIMEIEDMEAVIHEYSTRQNLRTRWLPVWEQSGDIECRRACKEGWKPAIFTVQLDEVEMAGKIKGEVLSDDTKRRLLAKGYFWALPVGTAGASE